MKKYMLPLDTITAFTRQAKLNADKFKLGAAGLLLYVFFVPFSYGDNTIDVTSGKLDPVPIAINGFAAEEAEAENAKKIVEVITADLKNSGVFRPISSAAFIENKRGVEHTPLFAAWQQINGNLLVNGSVTPLFNGKIRVKFVLWDSLLEKKICSEAFELPSRSVRRAAHKIADKIYSSITGYVGYFDTKIAFIDESGPYLKRKKRLAIMDQDGAGLRYLTSGANLVLTPRFSPESDKILYLSYKNRTPQIYLLDLKSGKSSILGKFPGMSFAPRFSPDGRKVIFSIAEYGMTHIYELDLATQKKFKLTSGDSINTSPCYSPDGRYIVFHSDRGGSRQLYVMGADGSNVHRISSGRGSYAEPVWSRNNYIAFTKVGNYGFTIGVMSMDDSGNSLSERVITQGYLVESSSWASNGRVIMFTQGSKPSKKITGLNRLYAIDFTGYNRRLINTPGDASGGDWSGPLP